MLTGLETGILFFPLFDKSTFIAYEASNSEKKNTRTTTNVLRKQYYNTMDKQKKKIQELKYQKPQQELKKIRQNTARNAALLQVAVHMLSFRNLLFICRWHKPAATAIVSFVTLEICFNVLYYYPSLLNISFVILECFYLLVSSRYHCCPSRSFDFIHTYSAFCVATGSLYKTNIRTR